MPDDLFKDISPELKKEHSYILRTRYVEQKVMRVLGFTNPRELAEVIDKIPHMLEDAGYTFTADGTDITPISWFKSEPRQIDKEVSQDEPIKTCAYGNCDNPVHEDTLWCEEHRCTAITKSGKRCKNNIDCSIHTRNSALDTNAATESTTPATDHSVETAEPEKQTQDVATDSESKLSPVLDTALLTRVASTCLSPDDELSISRFTQAISPVFGTTVKQSQVLRIAARLLTYSIIDYHQLLSDFQNSPLSKKHSLTSNEIEEFLFVWLWENRGRPCSSQQEFQKRASDFIIEQLTRQS